MAVCLHCKQETDDYELLTKADAQAQYLLTDSTLRSLPSVEKGNPRHATWTKMKLFLRLHLRERAAARWGGAPGLDAEKEKRKASSWESALKRCSKLDLFGAAEGELDPFASSSTASPFS